MPEQTSVAYAGKPGKTRGNWIVRHYPVTAAQTFKVGDWVYLTSGALSICATASNDVGNIKPLGIAMADAAEILDADMPTYLAKCPVLVPEYDGEFALPVYHSTAASAVITDANVGTPLTLPLRNQAGVWCANLENNGTNDRVVLVERCEEYSATDDFPLCWFKLTPANRIEETS